MRLLNFTIIKLTFFLIIGIIIGYFIDIPLSISVGLTFAFLFVLIGLYVVARKQFIKTIWFGVATFILMICIGILTTHVHNQKYFPSHYSNQISEEDNSLATTTVRIREILKSNLYYDKYVVDILKIDNENTSGKSVLNVQKDSLKSSFNVDDLLILEANFQTVNPPLNPHQFNYKNYLETKYIYHQLYIRHGSFIKANSNATTLFGMANAVRQHINKKLKPYHFKPDELAIINALLLGQRQDISEDVYSSYKDAGVIHILAVSGLHVGIILLILLGVFKPIERLKHGKLIKTLLIVCILWGFAIIAGLSPSVTRAVTMFSIVAIALNLKRPTNIYNTLAISMFIILLFKPLFLFDVGFQLSYLAVFSIVTFNPLFQKLWNPKNKLVKFYWQTLTVTCSAQLGIMPVTLYYFHQFPGLFFISNLVIIPFLGVILGFGILVIVLAVMNMLPQFVADTFGYSIGLMNDFVGWVSHQESFIFKDIPFSLLYVLLCYLLLISFTRLLLKRNFKRLQFFLLTVLIFQVGLIYSKYNIPSNEFIVFHKSRYSLLGKTLNNEMIVADDLDSVSKSRNSIIKDYTIANHIKSIEEDSIRPIYQFHDKTLFVVDSLGVYGVKSFKPDYVLLRQSPKINLNRLIDSLKPELIIADGSNYKSYTERWEAICRKRKIPFHQTGKKGAYIINY